MFQNVTLYGNRVFADDRVKVRSLAWALIQCGCELLKGEIWTQRETHREGQCYVKTGVMLSQAREHQRRPAYHQTLGEHRTDSPSQPSEGTNPANTLFSDLQPPEPCDNTCLLRGPLVCGTLLRQPQQTHAQINEVLAQNWAQEAWRSPLGLLSWMSGRPSKRLSSIRQAWSQAESNRLLTSDPL